MQLDATVFPFVTLERVEQFRLLVGYAVQAVKTKAETIEKRNVSTIPLRVRFQKADPVTYFGFALDNMEEDGHRFTPSKYIP